MSTLRRLGEELYKPRVVKFSEETLESNKATSQRTSMSPPRISDKKELKEGAFFKSSNIHVRILSSLIILQTLTQGRNRKATGLMIFIACFIRYPCLRRSDSRNTREFFVHCIFIQIYLSIFQRITVICMKDKNVTHLINIKRFTNLKWFITPIVHKSHFCYHFRKASSQIYRTTFHLYSYLLEFAHIWPKRWSYYVI